MAIMEGISAVSTAIGIAKTLRDVDKTYDAATYKAQIAEILNALTDAKLALAEAKDEIAEQAREIDKLKASFELQSKLVKGDDNYNYMADENDNPVGFPVCPKCEGEGKIVQTKQHGGYFTSRCPRCSQEYKPATCYLAASDGGPRTLAEKVAQKRAAENARVNAMMKRNRVF